ncbi:MAG: hypothetical protein WAT77_13040 [Paracoccaceae bacterium]
MAFVTGAIEAQIQLIDWRNTQLAQITDQLEGAFPELQKAIDDYVAALPLWKVAGTHASPRKTVVGLVEPWAKAQSTEAAERAKAQLDEILANVPSNSEAARLAASFLPALAGVGMIASSVAALPALVTFATVSSTSFFLVTTSAVSVPLLLMGGSALAVLSLTGSKAVSAAAQKSRAHLAQRLQSLALSIVFGIGLDPGARCLLNDIQASVLKAGETAVRGAS